MLVRYWNPWQEMETLRRQLDRVFDDFTPATTQATTRWAPAIELKDAGDTLVLRAQIPGIDPNNLNIQVTREAVAIAGEQRHEEKTEQNGYFRSEFRYGKFERVVPLPVAIQNTKVEADYKDGILTLTLPKVEEVRNQVVKINLAELNSAETPAPELNSEASN